uniref:Peroxisomal membrane protein PEX14 n=1 Tax=Clastoptera arizonana TaxID=38151 RepID=A0A1B6CD84_9HEMI
MADTDDDSKTDNNFNVKTDQIREDLVNTAVRFLQTKKIQDSPNHHKRKFLLKKGLSEIEVNLSFERAGLPIIQEQQFNPHVAVNLPQNAQLWQPRRTSTWHLIRDIANTITALGGLLYGIYWLWKNYIYPYLYGNTKKKSVETSLSELETKVDACKVEFKSEIQTVQNTLKLLAEQKSAETANNSTILSRIQETSSQIATVKGLLLNRNQFPPPPPPITALPTASPSIPSWQLQEGLKEVEKIKSLEDDAVGSGSNNGSDSSS